MANNAVTYLSNRLINFMHLYLYLPTYRNVYYSFPDQLVHVFEGIANTFDVINLDKIFLSAYLSKVAVKEPLGYHKTLYPRANSY